MAVRNVGVSAIPSAPLFSEFLKDCSGKLLVEIVTEQFGLSKGDFLLQ